eukprot:COSAG01_NODE_21906_length_880_cov_0.982074_1_plen_140_part_01
MQLVQRLLRDVAADGGGGGLDRVGDDGWTCLHHASALGMRAHVEALMDGGTPAGGGDRQRASTTLRTQLARGEYAKGLTALEVAQVVQRGGRADRSAVIEILLLGAQAEGWGDWRQLELSDGQRRAALHGGGGTKRGGSG